MAPRQEVTDGIPQTWSEYRAGPKGKGYAKALILERKAPFDRLAFTRKKPVIEEAKKIFENNIQGRPGGSISSLGGYLIPFDKLLNLGPRTLGDPSR